MKKYAKFAAAGVVALAVVAGMPAVASAASYDTTQHWVELDVINNDSASGGRQGEICNWQSSTNTFKFWMDTTDNYANLYIEDWPGQTGHNWVTSTGGQYADEYLVTLDPGYCQGFTYYDTDGNDTTVRATVQSGGNWQFNSGWVSYN